jgi:hypothetical protein
MAEELKNTFKKYVPDRPAGWEGAWFSVYYSEPPNWRPRAINRSLSAIRIGRSGRPLGLLQRPDLPEQVEQVALCAADALRRFKQLLFRKPQDFLFVLDLGSAATTYGTDIFHADTRSSENRINMGSHLALEHLYLACAHEIFHRIQFEYCFTNNIDACAGTSWNIGKFPAGFGRSAQEGTARLAEELALPMVDRTRRAGHAWLQRHDMTLVETCQDPPGRAPPLLIYESHLFWGYLVEQHGSEPGGADALRVLLETIADFDGSCTLDVLRFARARLPGPGHFDCFWPLGDRPDDPVVTDTTWGNFLIALLVNDQQDSRFRLPASARQEDGSPMRLSLQRIQSFEFERLPAWRPLLGNGDEPQEFVVERGPWLTSRTYDGFAPTVSRINRLFDPDWKSDVGARQRSAPEVMLRPFSYLMVNVRVPDDGANHLLRVDPKRVCGLGDAIVQVALLDRDGHLLDLHRMRIDAAARVMSLAGACSAVVIVASCREAGDVRIGLSRIAEPVPLLSITDWNCMPGRKLSVDPRQQRWTWESVHALRTRDEAVQVQIFNRGTDRATNVDLAIGYKRWDDPRCAWTWEAPSKRIARIAGEAQCRREAALNRVPGARMADRGCVNDDTGSPHKDSITVPDKVKKEPSAYCLRIEARCSEDPNGVASARIAPFGTVPLHAPAHFQLA